MAARTNMGGLAFCVVLGGLRAINGCTLSLVVYRLAEGVLYAGSLVTYYCHTDVGRLCFHSYKLTRCFSCIPSCLCPLDYIILWVCFLPHCLPLHPSFLLHYPILELLITSCQLLACRSHSNSLAGRVWSWAGPPHLVPSLCVRGGLEDIERPIDLCCP